MPTLKIYNSTTQQWDYISGGSEPSLTLSNLTDTTITTPSNGQVLTYDNSTSKWVNASFPTELPSITGNANKILAVNSGATGVEWITNSGGGLTNYDFTALSTPTITNGTTTITFAANQRNEVEFSTNADLTITLISNNKSDNYIWITNSHSTDSIDITFSSISFGASSINDVKGTSSIPVVNAGETLEIGVYVSDTKARITSRIL